MISLEELILTFYIWVFNTTIEVTMKTQIKLLSTTTFRHSTKYIMVLVY